MKRMLLLSMAFHTGVAVMLLLSPPLRHVLSLPPVYQVNLVTLPSPPVLPKAEVEQPPPAPPVKKVKPLPLKADKPKPVAKQMPKPQQVPPELARKETGASSPKPPPAPRREGTSKPQAVASVPSITAAVDIPDFKFKWYTELIQAKISSVWSPPPIEVGHDSKEVVVSFVLITTGKIKEVQVEKSSGNTFFDQAALRAVYMADPLPPLPQGFHEPNLKVHFSFVLAGKG